ncbi:hypothetical protein [Brachybacterium sp.]|uniref:hypothetical protein n=1 Tax=Brachybacterium sp. TaxID=1891286 RepID=UPI002ED5B84C
MTTRRSEHWDPATRAHFRDADQLPLNVDPAGKLGQAGDVQGTGTHRATQPVASAGHRVKVDPARRRNRMLRTNSARLALGPFLEDVQREPDASWFEFWRTTGDFSLLDLILVLLDTAGPSEVTVETWSAGLYDMEVLNRFITSDLITSFRLVLDVSFRNNRGNNAMDGTSYAAVLEDVFGLDAIRTTRTHAKNVIVRGGAHDFVILSSANLNENKRAEWFTVTNDPGMVEFGSRVADELFGGIDPGWHPDRGAEQLDRIDSTGSSLGARPMSGIGVMGA